MGRGAFRIDPRDHVVLAVKVGALAEASAGDLRPSANPDRCAATWWSGLAHSRPTQTGVRHGAVLKGMSENQDRTGHSNLGG